MSAHTETMDELERKFVAAESALADATRAQEEAEAKHTVCDAQVRELVSKALAAVRGQEAAELALAVEREAHEETKRDHAEACALVARMHAAAVGEVRGPDVGPVEDVAALASRASALAARVGELEGVVTFEARCPGCGLTDCKDPDVLESHVMGMTEADKITEILLGCRHARRALSRPAAGATTEHDGEEGGRRG